MSAPELVVRADAGAGVGVGHLARCLALTQAWVDWGGKATLVSPSAPSSWVARYRREGVAIRDLSQEFGGGADWAVLDGYRFGGPDEELVRKAARRLLVIDDHGIGGGHGADLVLDQNLGATASPYEPDALLGTRYALLRRDFRPWHSWTRDIPDRARHLLVALGGSPPEDVVSLVRATLDKPSLRDLNVAFLNDVDDVASAMARADLALSASGTTCWELCCLGVPAVLVAIASNQEPLARAMHRNGVAHHAGMAATVGPASLADAVRELALDAPRRARMARRGPQLVDGRGARRVVTRMRSHLLDLRAVREDDARLLWEWVNDALVRASAFNGEQIGWEAHVSWLAGRLGDPSARMYLASHSDGTALGQVRFEGDATEVAIDVSLASPFRNRGWGAALIDAAVRRLFEESPTESVIATIKTDNERSQSAFEDAAFVRDPTSGGRGIRYVRQRSPNVQRS